METKFKALQFIRPKNKPTNLALILDVVELDNIWFYKVVWIFHGNPNTKESEYNFRMKPTRHPCVDIDKDDIWRRVL